METDDKLLRLRGIIDLKVFDKTISDTLFKFNKKFLETDPNSIYFGYFTQLIIFKGFINYLSVAMANDIHPNIVFLTSDRSKFNLENMKVVELKDCK